jgi:hypothetical protein
MMMVSARPWLEGEDQAGSSIGSNPAMSYRVPVDAIISPEGVCI